MRRSAIVYCRRTPLASETFSSTRVIPEITPSTCSKRPSLAADAARSISAARRSPTVGDVLLRSRSASTSTAPGGSATRPVGVARAPGGRTASCTAAGGGPGWEGGGAGGEAEGGGDGARSEEHTSELQSRLHLVCRLLLGKKKKHQSETPVS